MLLEWWEEDVMQGLVGGLGQQPGISTFELQWDVMSPALVPTHTPSSPPEKKMNDPGRAFVQHGLI